MSDQLEMFSAARTLVGYRETIKTFPMTRTSDPSTSHKAAKSAKPRTTSQRIKLLSMYRAHTDLTAEEAGIKTGLIEKPGCCYWHRVSDLVKDGMIEPTGQTRLARSGEQQRVNRITPAGTDLLRKLGL